MQKSGNALSYITAGRERLVNVFRTIKIAPSHIVVTGSEHLVKTGRSSISGLLITTVQNVSPRDFLLCTQGSKGV